LVNFTTTESDSKKHISRIPNENPNVNWWFYLWNFIFSLK